MAERDVWIALTKSRSLPGCEIDMDGCEFYFADSYLAMDDEKRPVAIAILAEKVKEALLSRKLELAEISFCARFVPEEWVDQTDSIETMYVLSNKALESSGVIFSGFRSEEIQELYRYQHTAKELDEIAANGK